MEEGKTAYRRRSAIRDAAVCELLFATGLRIFELCSLKPGELNLTEHTVFIHGKGAKERILQIGNEQHITPHMWRHTFATALLEADVDIRYILSMLGHSSIHTTEIYTHVSMAKQKDILKNKHPRNGFKL